MCLSSECLMFEQISVRVTIAPYKAVAQYESWNGDVCYMVKQAFRGVFKSQVGSDVQCRMR